MRPLRALNALFEEEDTWMPAYFVGHGSPMNGIEDNEFSRSWTALAASTPKPKAILCISAHWLTRGTAVTAMQAPPTIHDFGGFPQELFNVQYPAPGDPTIARWTADAIQSTTVGMDQDWGLDHGTWTILRHMYPNADIHVLQLSIDYTQPPAYHYQLAREIQTLRKKGVLIIGSGNMVHNLGMVDFARLNENYGFDWALEMNDLFKKAILENRHEDLVAYQKLSKYATLAIPSLDHYLPLIYTLGLQLPDEKMHFFNDRAVAGSLTMTSVAWEGKS